MAFLWPCWKWSMPRQPTRGCTLAITTTRRQKKMRSKADAFTSTCQVSCIGPLDQPCCCPDSPVCCIRDLKKYKSNKCLLQKIRKIQEKAQNEVKIICSYHCQEIFIFNFWNYIVLKIIFIVAYSLLVLCKKKKSEMYLFLFSSVKFHEYLLCISRVSGIVLSVW